MTEKDSNAGSQSDTRVLNASAKLQIKIFLSINPLDFALTFFNAYDGTSE